MVAGWYWPVDVGVHGVDKPRVKIEAEHFSCSGNLEAFALFQSL